ncbi:remorin-like isoform X1 [Juglans microcarpa x Juglans regia]|uniref:remorin-like isoform X1 n=1 Tax=Juglans microcarpa x Juglans regia TaxID=2249226 RepID=UPI001B7DA22A|nr:remorin-like isoform X1 [Juglans microcarpa x Juglans regia]
MVLSIRLMEDEEVKKVEAETLSSPPLAAADRVQRSSNEVAEEEKVVVQIPPESKVMVAVVQKTPKPAVKKASKGSIDRDIALSEVEMEKRLSFVNAWEESEKTKAQNKAQKKFSAVAAWENSKIASVEANLRKIEATLEKLKADYREKMNNKAALIHKQAEEKRAMIEARLKEDFIKIEEMAAKYRATGHPPKKQRFRCF